MKLTQASLVQFRVAHLAIIQGIIGRMSLVSGTLKGFCVTVVAAVLALQPGSWTGRLGLVAAFIFAFGYADVGYLGLEREFRHFYDQVRSRPLSEAADMAITRPNRPSSYIEALRSWSILAFYGPLLAAALLLGSIAK